MNLRSIILYTNEIFTDNAELKKVSNTEMQVQKNGAYIKNKVLDKEI